MLDFKIAGPNPADDWIFESGKNKKANNEEWAPPFIFFAQDTPTPPYST